MEYYHENKAFEHINMVEDMITDVEFVDCCFESCTFENCSIDGCRFTDCQFVNCRITNVKAEDTTMMECGFIHCSLIGISWSTLFGGGYIMPINRLEDCQLKYNNFVEMNFAKFDFSNNTMIECMFADCNLSASKFLKCDLSRTEFFKCNLNKADFREAAGYAIDLSTNQLKGARFSFPEVVNLLNGLGIIID